jgi:hypothetical protein
MPSVIRTRPPAGSSPAHQARRTVSLAAGEREHARPLELHGVWCHVADHAPVAPQRLGDGMGDRVGRGRESAAQVHVTGEDHRSGSVERPVQVHVAGEDHLRDPDDRMAAAGDVQHVTRASPRPSPTAGRRRPPS